MRRLNIAIIAAGVLAAAAISIPASFRMGVSQPALAAGVGDKARCSRADEDRNKEMVKSFKPGPGFYESVAPDYLQHNREYTRFGELNGMTGRDAVLAMDEYFARTGQRRMQTYPGQPTGKRPYMLIAECDIVVEMNEVWHPDTTTPGKFYATYFFNVWRIRDGKISEHWDAKFLPDPVPAYLQKPLKELK